MRADKNADRDLETDQTCMLMKRSNSVLSDVQGSLLLSRESDATRCAVPKRVDSEFDD